MALSAGDLWLTRTQPGVARLAKALSTRGYRTWVQPLLEIEQLHTPCPQTFGSVSAWDWLLVLSQHAIGAVAETFHQWQVNANAPRVAAVGASTAQALQTILGPFEVLYPIAAGSEGLLQLPELAQLRHQRILIATGAQTSPELPRMLQARGAQVEIWSVYQRRMRSPAWPQQALCGIEVSSRSALEALLRLPALRQTTTKLVSERKALPILVPSARVQSAAQQNGFVRVLNCRGADASALIHVMEELAQS